MNDDENNYRNEFIFTYNPTVPCVEMHVFGYHTSSQFRRNTEQLLHQISKYNVRKVLTDATYMVLIGKDDQEWLFSSFIPRAAQEAGFRACAVIKSKNYFGNVSLHEVRNHTDKSQFLQEIFDTRDEALNWLLNVDLDQFTVEPSNDTVEQSEQQNNSNNNNIEELVHKLNPSLKDSDVIEVALLRSELEVKQRVMQAQQQQIEQQQYQIEGLKKQITQLSDDK
jgi:hypothetical protein